MNNRYNIALIPLNKSTQLTAIAESLSFIADKYLLGKESLPHITLCQFTAASSDLPLIWNTVLDNLGQKSISLTLKEFSCITVANESWVSLLPNNRDDLNEMHTKISSFIKNPIKKIYDYYDPHLTLINTTKIAYQKSVALLFSQFQPISDTFLLSIGISDQIGQFKKILYSHNPEKIKTLTPRSKL